MKGKFLLELKRYLAPLNEEERNEILRFYEERFHTGIVYEGKTEQDIIDELESPRQIAMNVLDEYGYSQTNVAKDSDNYKNASQENKSHISKEEAKFDAWSIVWVILFDVFIVSAILPMLFGLVVGFGAGWFGFLYETIRLAITSARWYTLLLSGGMLILWLFIVIWLYELLISFVIWLLRWHLNAFSFNKASPVLKRLKHLKVSTYMQRHHGVRRLKSTVGTLALFAVIIGGAFSVLRLGTIYTYELNDMNEYTETYTLETNDALTMDLSLGYSDVEIRRTSSDTINVFIKELDEAPMTIEYSNTSDTLTVNNEFDNNIFSWNFVQGILTSIFQSQPSVIIEVPYTLAIESITINGSNGDILVNDININDTVFIDTTNGKIMFSNVTATDIEAKTSNGKITINNVTANNTMVFDTSNGAINGNVLKAMSYDFDSSNGKIILSNIDVTDKAGNTLNVSTSNGDIELTNVYVKEATLNTSNGDIELLNDDLTYIFDSVDADTSNGDIDMNVPRN
jgi:uncharacterized membrane protein